MRSRRAPTSHGHHRHRGRGGLRRSLAAARSAGLRWVSDDGAGIRRLRAGRGFRYLGTSGRAVSDPRALARIRSLAVPPAWKDVWICPDPRGHIQATGRDKKGRKQYRYHARWRETRDGTKYDRLLEFGRALPRMRKRVQRDLGRRGLPREKVLATVVRLLEKTLIRVGNEEYTRANRSFGLTTLASRHVKVRGPRIHFRFRGKSGKVHDFGIEALRLLASWKPEPAEARLDRRLRQSLRVARRAPRAARRRR